MANILLYGFNHNINIKEDIVQFLLDNYPNIQIKFACTKDSCLKILREIKIDCLIINQTEEDSSLFQLLKSLEKNISYNKLPLIGINTSKINLNLNISDSFIANLFLPLDFEELKVLIENNVSGMNQNESKKNNKFKKTFNFKEKYDTRKSCFALCEAINDENNNIIDYKFLEINPEFAEFLDLMIEDIYSGTLKRIFTELGPKLVEMFNATPDNGKPLYYECHSKRNGKYFELITYKQKQNIVNTIIIDTTDKFIEEESIKKQKEKFGERVKELRCLYNITRVLNENNLSIKEILKKMIIIIPWAFKYPEIAKVKISVWKEVDKSNNYIDTEWKIEENIIIQKRRIGKISIAYQRKKPKEYIGPFLKDEVNLLRSICDLFGNSLEKWAVQNDLYSMNERLDIAYKAADFGVWDWNINENKFSLNSKYLEILGENESKNMISYNDWLERLHPDDKHIINENIKKSLAGNQNLFYQEFRIKTNNGDWKWVKDTAKIVKRDDFGKPRTMMGMTVDIDKEKNAKLEVEFRQQFEKIITDFIKLIPEGDTNLLKDGLNKINSEFSKLYGSDSSETVFYQIIDNEIVMEKVVKNSVNESIVSLDFSSTALKEISSILEKHKIVLIPNKTLSQKIQKEILKKTNCKSLLLIAINKGKSVKGYNLHLFKKVCKTFFSSEIEILKLYSELISNVLTKLNDENGSFNGQMDDESLFSKFILGITHELSAPSQYISDNVDFISENTSNYSDIVSELKSLISDNQMISTSEIKSLLEKYIDISKTEKIKNELKDAFIHTKLGVENVSEICKSVEEFSGQENVQNYIDINKLIQTVINFTQNEWKYYIEIIVKKSSDNLLVFAKKNSLRNVFLYLIVGVCYLIKPNKTNPLKKKRLNLITKKDGSFATVEIQFNIDTVLHSDFINIFENKIEVIIKGWNIAEKFNFCKGIIVNQLLGELFCKSKKNNQFSIVVRLPIEN